MKKYILINIVLLIIYLFPNSSKEIINNEETVLVMVNDRSLELSLDNYITNVLSCEMPALFNEEALKAGAVAIRTFYKYKILHNSDYIASNTDQCYMDEDTLRAKWGSNYDLYYNKMKKAVEDTSNEYIYYNDDIIEAFYFSMSNGYTENSENVFGEYKPYLVSVSSIFDSDVNNFIVTKEIPLNEFLDLLNLEEDFVIINNTTTNDTGRIDKISINNKLFSGIEIRKLLNLRSTDFVIDVSDNIKITTKGYGHGVGMSQYGANEMAKNGFNYKDILMHYYTGTKVIKNDV